MVRVALYGRSGVGKDYIVSKILEDNYTRRLSFSDQLKEITHNAFKDFMKYDYLPKDKEKPLNTKTSLGELITLSPRDIWLKMNFLREIESKIFIRMLDYELCSLENMGLTDFVITDVRTPDECEYVLSKGFDLVQIVNKETLHKENEFDNQQDLDIFVKNTKRVFENNFYKEITKQDIDYIIGKS